MLKTISINMDNFILILKKNLKKYYRYFNIKILKKYHESWLKTIYV